MRGSGRFAEGGWGTPGGKPVSIPIIAGQWSLPVNGTQFAAAARLFQSPSLRGSGRFECPPRRTAGAGPRFNPLHCGAVVASRGDPGRDARHDPVSIPFIAGQWSLLPIRVLLFVGIIYVSIPFIAGQWSLRTNHPSRQSDFPLFQSPSLRGSGRFGRGARRRRGKSSFNPLHCGAVVASHHRCIRSLTTAPVSIPFIAGQWSLPGARHGGGRLRHRVSIPFIAGQWSLQQSRPCCAAPRARVSIPFIAGQWSLRAAWRRAQRGPRVSIPFIAGQWSLQARGIAYAAYLDEFQSPSLRGSGRFPRHRGRSRRRRLVFQSPSLRGSGRFWKTVTRQWNRLPEFQSPSLRGSGRFTLEELVDKLNDTCFNPLHCGAVVASTGAQRRTARCSHVSIPFIAGQWSLQVAKSVSERDLVLFQSPSLRGSGRFGGAIKGGEMTLSSFNPLHCGAVVASLYRPPLRDTAAQSFNPLHCGAVVASRGREDIG